MAPLSKIATALVVLAAAVSLQGCKKKAPVAPAGQTAPAPAPLAGHTAPVSPGQHPVAARMAVDGHPCEHSWTAMWKDGTKSTCKTFCCYHTDRVTHARTRSSYCRVLEAGHEVLRACVPRHPKPAFLLAAESESEEPLELAAVDETAAEGEVEEDEEESEAPASEEEVGLLAAASRLGAVPLFACSAGVALGALAMYVAMGAQRRAAGSAAQKAPLIEAEPPIASVGEADGPSTPHKHVGVPEAGGGGPR
eukprot:CAMPEP_0177527266 /NCGR_PEP_ID=MMETSP0369-20130122/51534_1 /TAXON_ID=447022 ORGANISM="Scrippsiella hangoei-like, Strain SHHI-4" /NCGR_SAMPLE_ID=MMETSP0369 /ASSEMBLY_ACC=CAM_ASM_000364 /LENGTH=250 /DNA_ID=CAMNT_0019007563 /DNA_START=81 /DNA_END=831 /DNA_ORIENTATION=-